MSVYTTGWPGESGAGLVLLQQPAVAFDTEARAHLVRRHLAPEVHPELATQLVARAEQIAMIDLSDGVAKDAGEIARASGVALVIDKLPVSPFLALGAKALGKAPEEFILHGGEDYELLFCTSLPEEALRSVFTGHPIHQIGFVEEGEGVHLLRDGVRMPIGSAAFDHFR
jgi:thiamine-monophosphate kinase